MSVSPPQQPREPPVYRPFALLAFGTTLVVGTPLGIWMLAWLYLSVAAVPIEWVLLHAHLQIFGFFATLIPGVAPHLVARFTGRPVVPSPLHPWLAGALAAALVTRTGGTWWLSPEWILIASLLEAAAFATFGAWVWRSLDPPELALLRRQLTVSTGWLVAACLLETTLRWRALTLGLTLPDLGGIRAVHTAAIFGGVLGWVLGVLLRAGPMFVSTWNVPAPIASVVPWILALGILTAITGEMGGWTAPASTALARLGDLLATGSAVAVTLSGGLLRRRRKMLPMLSRSAPEARIFRLAVLSAHVAFVGSALTAVVAWSGAPTHLLTDTLRHLVTVGLLTSVVIAMAFRLIPVLEWTALPWPQLRSVTFWALLGGVLLRSAEIFVGYGSRQLSPLVVGSGILVWTALMCVGANLAATILRARRSLRPP